MEENEKDIEKTKSPIGNTQMGGEWVILKFTIMIHMYYPQFFILRDPRDILYNQMGYT